MMLSRLGQLSVIAVVALVFGCAEASDEELSTPAQLVGTANVDPLPGPLTDPLIIYVDDSISGAVLTVPFTAATATSADVVEAVNAVTPTRVVASVEGGRLVLTTVEAGQDIFLSVYDTASSRVLGLSELPLARGTATVREP